MAITIKTEEEIKVLSEGGQILATVLQEVGEYVEIGRTTQELDDLAERLILKYGGLPSFKGYGAQNPFPSTLCTSINEEIVHCIPQQKRVIKKGDIIGLDIGMKWPQKDACPRQGAGLARGLFTDHAITVPVEGVSVEVMDLIETTQGALNKAISELKPDMYVGEIGGIIEDYVQSRGNYGIVRDLVGHGVGYKVHEEPKIYNFKSKEKGEKLRPGMVLAIEPMINLGGPEIKAKDNGWDIITQDGSISAHFEHTVVITKNGCRVLTKV